MATSPGGSPGDAPVVIPHETLDRAAELGLIAPGVSLQETDSIGDGPDGAADVVWYTFSLDGPARVDFQLTRQDPASSFDGVLSLFNNDPGDYGDPYDLDGHRLLAQVDGKADGGVASLDELLGQGTYYLAVSGDGNFDFHPLIAGSGIPGSTGGFNLMMSATDAGLGPSIGPQVLSSDPAPGSDLAASPLAIRVEFSGPLDPSTLIAGQTVQLLYSPDGNFPLDGQPVALMPTNFSPVTEVSAPGADAPQYQGLNELQVLPLNPLIIGDYELVLTGQGGGGSVAIADPNGNPLGADAAHPQGQDVTIPFQVGGVDGVMGADTPDDSPATAQQLGNLTSGGLVQVAGAIGDDPFAAASTGTADNQVDLYHFTITGTTDQAIVAEVFAGRIGSPLDPGVALYGVDPTTGQLVFIAGNNNTGNNTTSDDGFSEPLLTDSALYATLAPGDYYVAVADGYNLPSPLEGQYPGWGVYDPNQPGGAQFGWTAGPYVLNLLVQPAPPAPHVLSTSPEAGSTISQPPTQLVVTFDQPMNLSLLAYQSYQQLSMQGTLSSIYDTVPAIYVEGADGTIYVPRFESYDAATNQATFLMLDALPNGVYQLHLSGADGLADVFGAPLVGDTASGDYVVPFTVDAAPRGTGGDPLEWTDQEPNDGIDQPQDIGVLFPDELAAGVTITRDVSQDPATAPRDTADVYEFQVLLDRTYTFTLTGADLPSGVTMSVTDLSGQSMNLSSPQGPGLLQGGLAPGTYLLTVSGWDASQAADVSYQLNLAMPTQNDNAPPLLAGPAPAVAILLDSAAPPTSSPTSPPVAPPPAVDPPPVAPPPVVDPPPVVEPPGSDSSPVAGPVGPPSSGEGSSAAPTTAATAAFAIAAPGSLLGGPSAYGVTSTDVGALAASPMGGVVAPGAQMSATLLAQSNAAVPQSSMTTGLVVLGTSVQVIGPGEEAAATGEESNPPAPSSDEVGDWPTLRERFALIGERTLALLAGISDHTLTMAAEVAEREVAMSPAPQLRQEPSATAPSRSSASVPVSTPHQEEEPRGSQPARIVVLAAGGLALGAYARYRGFARREGRRGEFRKLAGPMLWRRRPLEGVGMGRSQA